MALAAVVYRPSLGGSFTSDDFVLVERALEPGLFAVWGEAHGGFLRPLVGLLFELDAALWGLDAPGYRLTNLLLHVVTSLLVGMLATRVARVLDWPRALFGGWLAGGLFLVHPSHGEAVAWIAGRTDLLSTLFQVAGLVAALVFVESGRATSLAAALAAFTLALGAKESALPWPGVVLALGGLAVLAPTRSAERARAARRLAGLVGGSAVLLAAYFATRRALLGVWLGGYGTERHLALDPMLVASRAGRFVVRSVAPGSAATKDWAMALLAILVVSGVALAISRWRPLGRLLTASAIAFACSTLTALTALDVDLASPRGERFLYLPTVFVCLAVAAVVVDRAPSPRARSIVGLGLVLVAALATVSMQPGWRAAADTSRALVAGAAESLPADAVVWVSHLPSEQRGRFVLHNGLGSALRLVDPTPPRLAVPLVLLATEAPAPGTAGSGAVATIQRDGPRARIVLRLDPGARIAESRLPDGWSLAPLTGGRVELVGEVPPGVELASVDD